MIKLTGINKIYRTNEIETLALENVNLDVAKGEFVSIMGPSGCGKSTLLNIICLLYTSPVRFICCWLSISCFLGTDVVYSLAQKW